MKIGCRLHSILFVSCINPERDEWNRARPSGGKGNQELVLFWPSFLSTLGLILSDAELPQHHRPAGDTEEVASFANTLVENQAG